MIVLLAVFNGREIFDWNGVTLNAIVSILSVSFKASLTYVIAECIGQWKWILFSQGHRPLIDFETIDEASRGSPSGTIYTLNLKDNSWTLRFSTLIMLAALALGPFSQQLVQLRQDVVFGFYGSMDAVTTRATTYSRGDFSVLRETDAPDTAVARVDVSMKTAILTGLTSELSTVQQQTMLHCATGNCTWPTFETLGVCHRCNDLSQELEKIENAGKLYRMFFEYSEDFPEADATAFALPNGHFTINRIGCETDPRGFITGCERAEDTFIYDGIHMTSFGTGDPARTNSMQDIDTLIWAMSVIHMDLEKVKDPNAPPEMLIWPTAPLIATECALYYCVKSIDSSVVGGQIIERSFEVTDAQRDPGSWQLEEVLESPLHEPQDIPPADEVDSLVFDPMWSSVQHTPLSLYFPKNITKEPYNITQAAVKSISAYFQELLSTNLTDSNDLRDAMSDLLGGDPVGINGINVWDIIKYSTGSPFEVDYIWHLSKDDMGGVFESLATSMNNEIRRNSGSRYAGSFSGNIEATNDAQYGRAGRSKTLYRIEWYWIVLHSLLLVVGVYCWQRTVIRGRVLPVWKANALAIITQSSDLAGILDGAVTLEEMRARAREKAVALPATKSTPVYAESVDRDRYNLVSNAEEAR
ncbi:hypothetical protein DL769_000467 [Monosporascus sp. CRB-8-3]|nr:hypothetical protein DL769_000467 [Monosporascus sp. CRB-8-3]